MKVLFKLTVSACVVIAALSSCNNSTEKKAENVADAKAIVTEATSDLNEARIDSANDFIRYKQASELKITENNTKIAELKAKMLAEKMEANTRYANQLNDLDKKNSQLKSRIQDYKGGSKDKWDLFKLNFNKDMDELGKSISAFAEKNMKKI